MHLTSVELENFRGVGQLTVSLDGTTVLLGENRVGKTTVVDAVEYCLSAARPLDVSPFTPRDLRRTEDGPEPPIRLTLTFTEAEPGEWDRPELTPLLPLAVSEGEHGRWIRLRLTGRRRLGGEELEGEWTFLDAKGQPQAVPADPAQVQLLRDLHPCVVLSADRYDLQTEAKAPEGEAPEGSPEQLSRTVAGVYRRVARTRGGLSRKEIMAGLAAAKQLEEQGERTQEHEEPRHVREMVEAPRHLSPIEEKGEGRLSAQSLAHLLLMGSLLSARGEHAIRRDATPIVVIEEPEAHLHPILAVSLWGTLSRLPAQKLITTNSGNLLSAAPLRALRRLTRKGNETRVHQLRKRTLSLEDLRRVGYHVRMMRGASLFARSWLLVEGETEVWLIPELARICGYVLASEGVACIEFAQCGVKPLAKIALALGIEWHLLADGDLAGEHYADTALGFLGERDERERITMIDEVDVEHCLWDHNYADVFRSIAQVKARGKGRRRGKRRRGRHGGDKAGKVIKRAVRKRSKPYVALRVIEAATERGIEGVPPMLRRAIETAVWLARTTVDDTATRTPTIRPRPTRSLLDQEFSEGLLDD